MRTLIRGFKFFERISPDEKVGMSVIQHHDSRLNLRFDAINDESIYDGIGIIYVQIDGETYARALQDMQDREFLSHPRRFITLLRDMRFRKVFRNEIELLKQAKAYDQEFVYNAPALIIACSDPTVYADVVTDNPQIDDGTITPEQVEYVQHAINRPQVRREVICYAIGCALENLVLTACDMGLGTCIVRLQDCNKIRNTLKIPDKFDIHLTVCVGYTGESPAQRARLPMEELLIENAANYTTSRSTG